MQSGWETKKMGDQKDGRGLCIVWLLSTRLKRKRYPHSAGAQCIPSSILGRKSLQLAFCKSNNGAFLLRIYTPNLQTTFVFLMKNVLLESLKPCHNRHSLTVLLSTTGCQDSDRQGVLQCRFTEKLLF